MMVTFTGRALWRSYYKRLLALMESYTPLLAF